MSQQQSTQKCALTRLSQYSRPPPQNTFTKPKINVTHTQYPVIRKAAESLDWTISGLEEPKSETTIIWVDTYVTDETVRKLRAWQKINHFPASMQLGRKNTLAFNLREMKKLFPEEYGFFPQTWHLPADSQELKKIIQSESNTKYYIAKPQSSCQGRGIFLFNNVPVTQEKLVAQTYIDPPLLALDNLKFDFRLYVLLRSVSPLRIYLYQQGLVRFATTPYVSPNRVNSRDLTMHLTNYAINKRSPHFQFNTSNEKDNEGHKRSYGSVMQLLAGKGVDTVSLQARIDDIIIKTILAAQPPILDAYKYCRGPGYNKEPSVCFEILGFDIMLDSQANPYLLEVNHTPSLTTDTPLDLTIKKNLVADTINLVGYRGNYQKTEVRELAKVIRLGQTNIKWKPENDLKYQNLHKGAYRLIYPTSIPEKSLKYAAMIKRRDQRWLEIPKNPKYKILEEQESSFSPKLRNYSSQDSVKSHTKQFRPSSLLNPQPVTATDQIIQKKCRQLIILPVCNVAPEFVISKIQPDLTPNRERYCDKHISDLRLAASPNTPLANNRKYEYCMRMTEGLRFNSHKRTASTFESSNSGLSQLVLPTEESGSKQLAAKINNPFKNLEDLKDRITRQSQGELVSMNNTVYIGRAKGGWPGAARASHLSKSYWKARQQLKNIEL